MNQLPILSDFFPELLDEGHCVMVPVTPDADLTEYVDRLPESIVFQDESGEYGKEKWPHITVLYGISPMSEEKTKGLLSRMPKNMVATLGSISLFENPKFDVLKIDVESPHLSRINEFLCKNVEYNNEYPHFKPHVTLAYLKKGTGKNYVGDNRFKGRKLRFETFVYSNDVRGHTKIPMKEYSNLGLGGGYGGAAGGPLSGNWGATYSTPDSTNNRSSGTMMRGGGNIAITSNPYEKITKEDLTDPRFSPDEIFQGLRMEMKKMEFPNKTAARKIVIKHLEQNPKYYSDLHMYLSNEN